MALPLLAGIAVGSLAVIAFNNKEELKEKIAKGASKAKDVAQTSFEKTKEVASEVSKSAKEKLACKKEEIKEKEEDA